MRQRNGGGSSDVYVAKEYVLAFSYLLKQNYFYYFDKKISL